ncbi:coiled-coil domain-containing protein 63-like [Pterocles gutturalis]
MPAKEREKLAEAEIRRLQKKCCIAAEKRKSYGVHVRQQMQAQEKEVLSLTQEHREVLVTLSQTTSVRNRMLEDRNDVEFRGLLETRRLYDSQISSRKAQLAELDKQILELEKQIVRQNQIAAQVKQGNCSKRLQKQIETLERRLNNVTVHFNTIRTRNNKLREECGSLQTQKAVLDNIYLKLDNKLDEQMRRMNTAVGQATQAYEQWMEALASISAMKEHQRGDTVHHNVELQKLKRVCDQETKLKAFMLTKLRDLSKWEEKAKEEKGIRWEKPHTTGTTKQESAGLPSGPSGAEGESVESWEVTYKRLLELAEDGDIDQMINDFLEKEGKNLACFSSISELNSEMEKMQERIMDLEDEITNLMTDQEQRKSSRSHALQDLERKLTATTEEANMYEDICKVSSKLLGQLKSDMEALCKEISCDTTNITKQLGGSGQVTDHNVMQFFGLVEKKANELLLQESILRYTAAVALEADQPLDNPLLGGTGLIRAMDPAQLCLPPPALDSTMDAIDALEAPLDHGELRQLVLQSHRERGDAASTGRKGRNSIVV